MRTWRIEPFQVVQDGQAWVPPAMTAAAVSAAAHMTAAQRGGDRNERCLSELERQKWEDTLRGLTIERADICAAMVFAIDNADASGEVVETLSDALTLAETPVPLKIARLLLASDILHNATAPVRNASRYRSRLEAALPEVFESLREAYRGAESRIGQEVVRKHVLRVLRCADRPRSWSLTAA